MLDQSVLNHIITFGQNSPFSNSQLFRNSVVNTGLWVRLVSFTFSTVSINERTSTTTAAPIMSVNSRFLKSRSQICFHAVDHFRLLVSCGKERLYEYQYDRHELGHIPKIDFAAKYNGSSCIDRNVGPQVEKKVDFLLLRQINLLALQF